MTWPSDGEHRDESGWARPAAGEPEQTSSYGQNPYERPTYGQPEQPTASGQPTYGQPTYGQPPTPPYGQSSQPAAPGPTEQPVPAAPPYGQTYQPLPQPGAPYGLPSQAGKRPVNGMAIAAFVCALAGLVTGIAAPVGAILGHVAARQIAQTGEDGAQYAKAAIWIGWILTGLAVVGCCALFSFVLAADRSGQFGYR